MNDIGMAVYMAYPFIGAQMIPQHPAYGEYGQEPFYHYAKIIIGRIEDQVAGFIVRRNFCRKAAADAASVYDDMVFGVFAGEHIINKLHIIQHVFFAAFAGAFAKAAVIDQYHIIIVTVKITGILSPSLYAAGIAMKIQDQSFGIGAVEVQPADTYTRRNIKKQFIERDIVPELKIGRQLFWFENKPVLHQVNHYAQ